MTHRFVPVPLAPFALAAFVLGVAGPARAATLPVEPEAATADLTATVHAVKADADELEVVSGTGHALRVYTLRVGPGCQIRLEGESATLADLEPGQIVRVHYRDADGARVAMTIDAPPAPAAEVDDDTRTVGIGGSLATAAILLAPGCAKRPELGDPVDGLTRAERAQFDRGREVFSREFEPHDGLGPLFNSTACGECHEDPVPGGPGDEVEVHVAAFLASGVCDPLVERGGPVIQQQATPALQAALGIDKEPVPTEATARAGRSSPDVFGFGLLDAVPDAAILALADPDDRDGDGISGRPNRFFDGRLGRFGRKALVPTLREFNDGAFVIEQGVTNPAVPTEETIGGEPIPEGVDPLPEPEIDQAAIDANDAFVRFLAPPAALPLSKTARQGREVFSRIGCSACHVPLLETGDSPTKALRRRKVAAYTDLLLHDMGPELADICFGLATPSEFRTEPLMGLRLSERFLHDGRAESLEEAIHLHGGEASASRERFDALSEADRRALLEFLESL